MRNERTGRNEPYEEVWRRLPIATGAPILLLQSASDSLAFIGQVGPHAIAITGQLGGCDTWREELQGAAWKRRYDIGDTSRLPSLPVSIPNNWQTGWTITWAGQEWTVLERSCKA